MRSTSLSLLSLSAPPPFIACDMLWFRPPTDCATSEEKFHISKIAIRKRYSLCRRSAGGGRGTRQRPIIILFIGADRPDVTFSHPPPSSVRSIPPSQIIFCTKTDTNACSNPGGFVYQAKNWRNLFRCLQKERFAMLKMLAKFGHSHQCHHPASRRVGVVWCSPKISITCRSAADATAPDVCAIFLHTIRVNNMSSRFCNQSVTWS